MPFMGTCTADDFESGTTAACGGITTIIDFAMQQKGETLFSMTLTALENWKQKADSKVFIDYGLRSQNRDCTLPIAEKNKKKEEIERR
jgi:dihydropyrimidinase